jgi:hypothetical protein
MAPSPQERRSQAARLVQIELRVSTIFSVFLTRVKNNKMNSFTLYWNMLRLRCGELWHSMDVQ